MLFVYPAYENLGVEYLSTALKKGGISVSLLFDPALFDDDFLKVPLLDRMFSQRLAILDKIQALSPKIVAFSVVTDRFAWASDLARAIKARLDTTIIIGGIHITGAPEFALSLPWFDYGFRGESDESVVSLVRGILNGNPDMSLPGLVYRAGGKVRINPMAPLPADLDALCLPDKDLFRDHSSYDPGDMYTIMASRGCPFACSFCNNSLIKGLYPGQQHLRFRSVENVISELEWAKERYSPHIVNFLDEVFAAKPSWLEKFVPLYREKIGLPFIACTHPAVESEKRVKLLAEAGCAKVDMGVQTLSDRLRKQVLFRPESSEQVRQAISWYKEAGITLFAENILGIPTETEQDRLEMVRFYNDCRPHGIKVFWLSYYPGTAIEKIAEEKGVALPSEKGNSIAQGGTQADKVTKQIYLLIQLLPLLSKSMVSKIIEKQWYRRFPTFFVARFAYLFGRLIGKQDPVAEVLMWRYLKHYRVSLKKILFGGSGAPKSPDHS